MSDWTPEQIQEHRSAFLAALRSDEFTQGRHRLTTVRSKLEGGGEVDCCLGVACKLAQRAGIVRSMVSDGMVTYVATGDPGDRSSQTLPFAVRDWLGVEFINPRLPYQGGFWVAGELNDEDQLSFSEIADLFEALFAMKAPREDTP